MASLLNEGKGFFAFEQFGKLLGKLFQMTDDILDVTGDFASMGKQVGKDEGKNKLTCVRLYGLEGAKIRADMCAKDCHLILESIEGDTAFLHELVDKVLERKN
jgi:geranylgeranyl pyrophosphate synthase